MRRSSGDRGMHMRRLRKAAAAAGLLSLLASFTAAAQQTDLERDRQMAETIRRVTTKESSDLPMVVSPDGSTSIDLAGRFRHVALAAAGASGDAMVGCVGSLAEANRFFGRNLETGERYATGKASEMDAELVETARLHGMSVAEYRFYSDLAQYAKSLPGPKASTISIVNNDGAGEGFNSSAAAILPAPGNTGANLGQQRLALFVAAADVWEAFLDSSIPIQVGSSFDPLSCGGGSAVLGSAGSTTVHGNFPNAIFTNTFYHQALANKLRNADSSAAQPDLSAQFNSSIDTGCLAGNTFYYGLDNASPAGKINLFVVLLHEMGHGLGFSSFTDESNGAYLGGFPDVWARFQLDSTSGLTWFQMTDAQRAASAVNTNNLYWDGANVRIASSFVTVGRDGLGRVALFTPNPVQPGSSVSHYTDSATPNLLMEPAINPGLPLTLDLSRQLMRDIGWYRDTTADLVRDTITGVSPSGGSVVIGNNVNITWTNNGGFNRNVTIELSTDGGATFPTVVASDVANTGTRSWTVPNTPTTTARIRVREHDFVEPLGSSATNFTIGGNTAPTFTPAAAVSRQLGSPAGAAVSVGTVADAQTAAGTLTVTQIAGGTATGMTVGSITNTAGAVTATIAAACSATAGTVRFQVSDGSLTGTGDLQVNTTANGAPTLSYANASVNGGSGTSVNPATGPSDNGTVAAVVLQGQGTYSGTISVNASGVVSIANAAPVGTHTITIRATDNCGTTTDASFQLTVNNTAPTFTAGTAISRQQGSAGTSATVGTASDPQQAAGALTVTQIAGGTSVGVTASSIVNTGGTITATVAASCSATAGTLRFQASDGSLTGSGDLQVNVTANTAPTVTYPNASVNGGGGTTVGTATASDNGTIAGYAVQGAGTYTGTISVSSGGVVTIAAAAPVGTHTITIRATDNCGSTTDASFQLTVNNTAPAFTPGTAISRQRGSAASNAAVGTASDPQQAAGTLVVTQVAGGTSTGVTATNIVNTNGAIAADVGASCTAAAGTLRFQASDGSLTGTGDLTVNLAANTAPTFAYANASVNGGSGTTVNPSIALSDNGSATAALQSAGTYTGGISVAANGGVTLTNAAPVGMHTITIRATDNCGTTTDATFQLTVDNTAPTFTAASAISRQQGSAGTSATVGTASDPQQGAGTLTVTQVAGGTSSGVSATGITNSSGTITATIAASCTATAGTLRFRASDGALTGDGDLTVNVTPNAAPTISFANTSINGGAGGTVNPSTALSDNGTATATLQSQGTYTGGISVASNGVVTLTNAAPVGTHTIAVRATDNCGTTTDASFQLTVNNTAPSLAAGGAVQRTQGSPGSSATIGTVSDPQQPAGSLLVTQVAGGSATGITTTAIANTSGTITATLAASCTATSGTVRFQVSDGALSSSADLQVNVQSNTPPVLGLYPPTFVAELGGATVAPTGAPSDNGSVVLLTAGATQPSFSGTFSGAAVTGNVTVANAGPPGAYTVNVVAEDNCGALGQGSFSLTVTPDTLFRNGFEDP
jgi:hypothetical protein